MTYSREGGFRPDVVHFCVMTTGARGAPDDDVTGPAATTRATARALAKAGGAAAMVLVEGISDEIAVTTAARGRGRDLDAERILVVPIGGAHAIRRFLTTWGPLGAGLRLVGLCDRAEEEVFRRALVAAQVGGPRTRAEMEGLGFFVCVEDLEDELIRAVGTAGVEAVFEAHGDLGAFRSLQNQPAWRGRDLGAQMRRFLGAGARRKLRYARLLVEAAVARDALPPPLDAVIRAVPPPHAPPPSPRLPAPPIGDIQTPGRP